MSDIALPTWEPEFVERSRSFTARMNRYLALRTAVILLAPSAFTVVPPVARALESRPALAVIAVFLLLAALAAVERGLADLVWGHRARYPWSATLVSLGRWCLLALLWQTLSPTNLLVATFAWWLGAPLYVLQNMHRKRLELRGACLVTRRFPLHDASGGLFGRHRKLGEASLHELAHDSPLGPRVAFVFACHREIYVSPSLRAELEPGQLRAVFAHEFGHALSPHAVGFEVAGWFWRLLGLPTLAWLASLAIEEHRLWFTPGSVFLSVTAATAAWLLSGWIARILHRPREMGADRYAAEVVRDPQLFVDAMARLVTGAEHPYNVFPNWADRLGACTHPSLSRRLDAIRSLPERRAA